MTLLFVNHICFSQKATISKTEAIQDIDTLQKYIEKIHPNAYAYVPKIKMNEKYENVKKTINDSLSVYELYNYLSYITANYGDGHLSTLFPKIWYKENHKVIPFTIDIEEGKLLVNKLDTAVKLPKNAEIIKINGIPSKHIIDTMLAIKSGEAINFKIEMIKFSFPKLLFSIYNMDNEYSIQYKDSNHIKNATINGITYEKYKKITNSGVNREFYSADFLPEKNICIIDFRDFADLNKFKIFTDSIFKRIKEQNINNLIIDLRNNSGGNSALGDELFQYISKTSFTQYEKSEMKISQHLKILWERFYVPQGIIDSSEFKIALSIPNDSIIDPNKVFSNGSEEDLISLRVNPNRFNGKVYILISNYTFSSAADFAWCFNHYNMGKVIGEETGGWGLCYGDNVFAQLPISLIGINVSCQLFYNIGATNNSTHGIIPDYKIKSENALEYTIKMIENE